MAKGKWEFTTGCDKWGNHWAAGSNGQGFHITGPAQGTESAAKRDIPKLKKMLEGK